MIGARNIFREFVTINRGTARGGGVTTIGDRNLFMAYVHVAHDCHVGNHTIFGPHATLGGHVAVEDYANISAGSAVHQFCRVGRHAFIGGYSVVTKDALPFGRTVGSRPARIFGAQQHWADRGAGSRPTSSTKLKRAYRYLLQSKLNTTGALRADRAGPHARLRRSAVPGRVHPHRHSAASSCGAADAPRRRESTSRTSNAGSDLIARERPVSVPGPRRGARRGPRGHGRRHQGRGVSRSGRRLRARPPPADLHWIALGQLGKCISMLKDAGVHAGGDGRTGQAHEAVRATSCPTSRLLAC